MFTKIGIILFYCRNYRLGWANLPAPCTERNVDANVVLDSLRILFFTDSGAEQGLVDTNKYKKSVNEMKIYSLTL